MNEITKALKIVNTAVRTVRIIDIARKTVITAAIIGCGTAAISLIRKNTLKRIR